MAITRHAEATWNGDLLNGSGTINYVSSGAFSRLPVTWAARTEEHNGKTSPEELIASAHAACFSMALSNMLAGAGHVVTSVDTSAVVHMDKVGDGMSITGIDLKTVGRVPGLTAADFQTWAENAKKNCIVSRALASVPMTLDATLVA